MSSSILGEVCSARAKCPLDQAIKGLNRDLLGLLGVGLVFEEDQHHGHLKIINEGDKHARIYTDVASGVLLMEVGNRDPLQAFEVFVVPHQDGGSRVGWRRPWGHDSALPPPAWLALLDHFNVEGRVQPQADPDFAVLLATIVAGKSPLIQYDDANGRASLAADAAHLRETVERQAIQLRKLQSALSARSASGQLDTETSAPVRNWRLSELAEWAGLHADNITLLPRALSEAKKSTYEDEQLVFDALDLLATTYRAVKRSEVPRQEFKQRADQLGLSIGGSVSFAGTYGDAYFVHFAGRRRFLDQHLGRGSSRDPRFHLRIYFFWDEEASKVVVGHLTSHLPNSMT